jgi:RNA polymerase sigma-70 factor (ECF subfamily)
MVEEIKFEYSNLSDIYTKYHQRLSLFAYRYLGSLNEAEDIVQSLFLKLFEKEMVLNSELSVKSYLFSAVRNACLNHIEKAGVKKKHFNYIQTHIKESDDNSNYELSRIEDEVLWELFTALEELPPKCRNIMTLSYFENIGNDDIAKMLNITVNTVKSQKQRAKQLMKERLKELFVFALILFNNFN